MNKINILTEIKRVIDLQSRSITLQKKHVGLSFKKAVEAIYRSKGNVIVTGVGKSGFIAQKIASTFSSTGTPSIYLHPVEGMHGNLGVVNKNDIVLAIGKSGESEEILNILPFLRAGKQIKIVGKNTPLHQLPHLAAGVTPQLSATSAGKHLIAMLVQDLSRRVAQ